jgi:hypothetical protein
LALDSGCSRDPFGICGSSPLRELLIMTRDQYRAVDGHLRMIFNLLANKGFRVAAKSFALLATDTQTGLPWRHFTQRFDNVGIAYTSYQCWIDAYRLQIGLNGMWDSVSIFIDTEKQIAQVEYIEFSGYDPIVSYEIVKWKK